MAPRQVWPEWVSLCSPGIPGWGAVAGMGLPRSAARNSRPVDIFVAYKGAVGHQAGDGQSQVGCTSARGPAAAFPEKQMGPDACYSYLGAREIRDTRSPLFCGCNLSIRVFASSQGDSEK